MKLEPMVRNNICLNAHPEGCAVEVDLQIERARAIGQRIAARKAHSARSPRTVLVIGASTGYGLATRIIAAFAYGARTVGFSFEREPSGSKTGTPGYYANREFDRSAAAAGLQHRTFETDAFSDEAKRLAVQEAQSQGFSYDLVIYSLASPVRTDPETGVLYRSVIKPIGRPYSGKSVDVFTGAIRETRAEPADEKEIGETVKVMGGEDWARWIEFLHRGGVLAQGAVTVAYSYLGPPLSWPIYKDGTIGRAKADLETTAKSLAGRYSDSGIKPFVSINKAVVTRASAVIPIIPLYVSTLFRVMKERHIHEDCLDQMARLFTDRLYDSSREAVPVDQEGRIRLDELEMGSSVQEEVSRRMQAVGESTIREYTDIDGFRRDFLRAHGFEVPGVDYSR